MTPIHTQDAPKAGGHYSQAIVANGFVFVAGQLPSPPDGGVMAPDVAGQTRQALANVAAILAAAGSGLDRVVSTTVYVTDIALWPEVNRAYADIFDSHRPARTVAVSPQLHHGALIEVQAIAVV